MRRRWSWSPSSRRGGSRSAGPTPTGRHPGRGNSVLVEFTLTEEGSERTRLRVSETGLDAIGWPDEDKARYVAEHRNGWAEKLGCLEGLFAAG